MNTFEFKTKTEFNSKEEAQRVADIDNMGRDYSTATVRFNGKKWVIVIA